MKNKSIALLLCLILLMLPSCGAKKINYTLIRPEYQEKVSRRIEDKRDIAQSGSDACPHNYTDYGVRSPLIKKYNDDEHILSCPLCHEILNYEAHDEELISVIENVAALKDGEQCDVRYSICKCGSFYKVLLYKHRGDVTSENEE